MKTRQAFSQDTDARVRAETRRALSSIIKRAIAALDALDVESDAEPSLGSLENHPEPYISAFDFDCRRHVWAGGNTDDREDDSGDSDEPRGALIYWGEAEPEARAVRRARA